MNAVMLTEHNNLCEIFFGDWGLYVAVRLGYVFKIFKFIYEVVCDS